MTDFYIDKRATGANDGTSETDAWQSLHDFTAGIAAVSSGDTVNIVAGSGVYETINHTVAGEADYGRTDVSFDAASNEIRCVSGDFATTLSGISAGGIIRVTGSTSNDRQFEVVSITLGVIVVAASNTITDEAAGATVNIVHVETSTQCNGFQLGKNGTSAANPITLNGNYNKICAGYVIEPNDSRFLWNESAVSGEWYLTMADGSNPSLFPATSNLYCFVVDGEYWHESSGGNLRDYGTGGSLIYDKHAGYGDADTLGYTTLYVKSTVNPSAYEVIVPQARYIQNFPDRFWVLNEMYYYGGADTCVNNTTYNSVFNNCIFAFCDQQGVRESIAATYSCTYNNCISWYSGHRGIERLATSRGTTNIYGHIDIKAHLGFRVVTAAGGTNVGTVNLYNCLTYKNESSALNFQPLAADVTFNEGGNYFYPDMTYTGWINYTTSASADEFTTTAATDYPASTATGSDPGTLVDPLLNIDLTDIDAFVGAVRAGTAYQSGSGLEDGGVKWWTGPNPVGQDGEPFSDWDTSVGAIQTKTSPFHPKNL